MRCRRGPKWLLYLLLVSLVTIGPLASDIYLPSLPAITDYFDVTNDIVQLSISFYLLGMSFSQLIYGPLSDYFGRRKILFSGIILAGLASFACIFAGTADDLVLFRLIQGAGTGACICMARAIIRDLYSGSKLAKLGSYLAMSASIVLAIGPVLGGYIEKYFQWRGCFVFIFCYLCLLLSVFYLYIPETRKKIDYNIYQAFKNYITLLKDKSFLAYSFSSAIVMGGLFAYITSAPFLFQDLIGLEPHEFGWMAILLCGSTLIGGYLNSIMLVKFKIHGMVKLGSCIIMFSGALMLFFGMLDIINSYVIIIPAMIFILGFTPIAANTYAGASEPFRELAGAVSALFGMLRISGGAVAAAIAAYMPEDNQIPISLTFISCGVLCFILSCCIKKSG